jgi:hypothetical protein
LIFSSVSFAWPVIPFRALPRRSVRLSNISMTLLVSFRLYVCLTGYPVNKPGRFTR